MTGAVLAVSPTNSTIERLKDALAAVVGAAQVSDNPAVRALHSEDIWSASEERVALVVTPRSIDDVAGVMKVAHAAGVAVAPRGASMSYTSSHLPVAPDTISLDMASMNRVIAVAADDMTVTVEAGCTWATLNAALAPLGLRTPFWGPMSGRASTIGGGLSQLNAMLGAGHYGTSSESVVALTMVLADGSVLKTGARGRDGDSPFYRHYGPDLTGLFCGDSGTLGIKAEITLRLIRAPAHEDYASFSFPTGEALLGALAEIARAGIASETCGFDPGLTRVRLRRMSLANDVKALGAVIAREKSFARGLVSAAKVALGGRNFVETGDYPLHVIAEGRSAAGVAADIAEARRIAALYGGHAIENTIAKVIRAMPFPPLNSMLGPEGEAWAPVHGMVALSQAPALFGELQAMLTDMAADFEREGIFTGYLFTSVSTNAITIEPVFYWPHGWRPIHEVHVEPSHLARLPKPAPNPAATAVVATARKRVVEICAAYGCGHFQIGRAYPYRAIRLERFARSFRAASDIVSLEQSAPGPGEIAVTNHWCGINGIFDTQIARNAVDYVNIGLPTMTGVEAIGTVTAIGPGVTGFAVGDAAATVRFTGGYREANVGPEAQFAKAPAATREWLTLASTGVSALLALEQVGQLKDGETVAISAAAGGLGHLMVQLAKLRGCRVVAVCGGAEKVAFVRGLGADRVIDYRVESVATVLASEFPNALDVAVDTVGGGIFDAFVDNLAPHGRLVAGGAAQDLDGVPETVTAPRIVHKLYYKGASVRGFMNGLLTEYWPEARARLFALHGDGKLSVTFDTVRFAGLCQVYDAVERLLSGNSIGKVVVDLRAGGPSTHIMETDDG